MWQRNVLAAVCVEIENWRLMKWKSCTVGWKTPAECDTVWECAISLSWWWRQYCMCQVRSQHGQDHAAASAVSAACSFYYPSWKRFIVMVKVWFELGKGLVIYFPCAKYSGCDIWLFLHGTGAGWCPLSTTLSSSTATWSEQEQHCCSIPTPVVRNCPTFQQHCCWLLSWTKSLQTPRSVSWGKLKKYPCSP